MSSKVFYIDCPVCKAFVFKYNLKENYKEVEAEHKKCNNCNTQVYYQVVDGERLYISRYKYK
ncbi:hypothetical protein DCO58_12500 [Helicobacter saguini]|uniref:Uncharacterized protein n=1 Tax=Helicobacter saguini TaxID=1548018 RepID=A0A347VQM4_9HELI|nr:hypothetical protein [Helicobacter saguini]MWV60891.1 hypothetical protein [Helicobacter saguini]MWV68441.1 hypothetical protein [Helicobacter saguini]MWV70095.1 hypothetical protein [Helicobacter saguini]MWV71998.1 hypothetical protein [Helicobacter saguini]TLD91654.1 hypothetical protein LS64_011530 [Helicobacter saguini]